MTQWFFSDPHFGHENIYKFINKDGRRVRHAFIDAADGDAYMLKRLREMVKPEDHIYFMGDITMARGSKGREYLKSLILPLPGHKRLLMGNHDHLNTQDYLDAGFKKIMATQKFGNIIFSHYPIAEQSIPKGCVNAHGHTHGMEEFSLKYINCSVERTGYQPISLEQLQVIANRNLALLDSHASSLG